MDVEYCWNCHGDGCQKCCDTGLATKVPVNMVIYCPACGCKHIDAPYGTWTNPPHRSHLCHHCGVIWRPADVPTNGVHRIETMSENDTWPPKIRAAIAKEDVGTKGLSMSDLASAMTSEG